ncbi:hypothetical protein [Hominenteromicrobium sp.]|uniref:hypothetical protein n=1 Tax=Hominenteromicrobium sp. TaxID=3073581 RepID=UPI00399629D5
MLVREALSRGHAVTAVVRDAAAAPAGADVLVRDLFDLTREDLAEAMWSSTHSARGRRKRCRSTAPRCCISATCFPARRHACLSSAGRAACIRMRRHGLPRRKPRFSGGL